MRVNLYWGISELACIMFDVWERFPNFKRRSDLSSIGLSSDVCLCEEYPYDNGELLCDWCFGFYVLEKRVIAHLGDMHHY